METLVFLSLGVAGVLLFFLGRFMSKRFESRTTFLPATFINFEGLLSYLGTLFCWTRVILALLGFGQALSSASGAR